MEYADLYDKMKANVGQPFTALDVAGAVLVSNAYTFHADGKCRVSSTYTELTPTQLAVLGTVVSAQFTASLDDSLAGRTLSPPAVAAVALFPFALFMDAGRSIDWMSRLFGPLKTDSSWCLNQAGSIVGSGLNCRLLIFKSDLSDGSIARFLIVVTGRGLVGCALCRSPRSCRASSRATRCGCWGSTSPRPELSPSHGKHRRTWQS